MNTDGPNLPNDGFDEIVAPVAKEMELRAAEKARAALGEYLTEHDGRLTEHQAQVFAEMAGRDARTVWRWRQQHLNAANGAVATAVAPSSPTAGAPGSDTTVLDELLAIGSEAFRFDDLMVSMMYLLNGSQAELKRVLERDGYPMPSLPTICRKWQQVEPQVRAGAKTGVKNRATLLIYLRHSAAAPNDRWQFDEFTLDIFVRTKNGKNPIKPSALLSIDDNSRYITSAVLLQHPMRSEDVLAALGAGFEVRPDPRYGNITIGGVPDSIVFDNATPILSNVVMDQLAVLPTTVQLSPAYTPTAKGKVERVGNTIQEMAIAGLPGRVTKSERRNGHALLAVPSDTLLSFEDFEAHFFRQVEKYNYDLTHSALGTTPFLAYCAGTRAPVGLSDEELAGLMIPIARDNGIRKVHPDGVHAFSTYYASDELTDMIGRKVVMRGWHHRHSQLALFDDGKFVAMIPLVDDLTADQRRDIVERRIDAIHEVHHHAKAARSTLARVGQATELGDSASPVQQMLVVKGVVPAPVTGNAEEDTASDAVLVPAAPRPATQRPPKNKVTKAPTATARTTPEDQARARARELGSKSLEGEV